MALQLDSSLALRSHPAAAQREPAPPPEPQAAQAFRRALDGAASSRGATPTSTARHVAAQRTPLTGGEAADALESAWQQLTGHAPSAQTLSILVGQWAHETGRGSAMLNYNFGGIKGTGPTGASTVYRTREGSGASEIQIQDRFRAYESAEQGASDYLSLLARRYPAALQAAERGDATGFVQALKARGYFTGDEAAYTKSVSALARQALTAGFDALGPGGARPTQPLVAPQGIALAGETPQPFSARLAQLELAGAQAESAMGLEAAGLRELVAASAVEPGAAAPIHADSLLLAARNLHTPDAQLPGSWTSALSDEVRRVDLLISALQIGQPGEKEEG